MNQNNLLIQEQAAINYVEENLIAQHSDFQAQGLWQAAVLNYLKNQAPIFISTALTHLKKQALQWAVDLAHWLLEKLTDYLVACYQSANQEEQEIFLSKIKEHFPESELLKKLQGK